MDTNKLTQKSQEALQAAQTTAIDLGHQEVDGELLLLALLGSGVAPSAFAQEDTWYQLDIDSVVPDKFEDYRELQFDDVNPALRKAGVPWRNVYRTAQFGNRFEGHLVRPITSFSQE